MKKIKSISAEVGYNFEHDSEKIKLIIVDRRDMTHEYVFKWEFLQNIIPALEAVNEATSQLDRIITPFYISEGIMTNSCNNQPDEASKPNNGNVLLCNRQKTGD